MARENAIVFALDGEEHVVENADPTLTLSDYIRGIGNSSVKIGCGEGGCGACTVVVARWDANTGTASYSAVNSCLMPLCSSDGVSVTTTRGLGDVHKGYHPIQERLAEYNGSQCGFCSPGMVMSMFGMLSAHPGATCPDEAAIEKCVDGNLCRCTGYRPILEAFRSFAGAPKSSVAGETFAPFPDFLKSRVVGTRTFTGSGVEWIAPKSLVELHTILSARSTERLGMVAGHTCRGVYKDDHLLEVLLDLNQIPELNTITVGSEGITFGATVTWHRFILTLRELADSTPEKAALPVLLEHATKVAGHSVRGLGTLGGNLAMTKQRGFASDLATILMGVNASVTVAQGEVSSNVPLDKFFASDYELSNTAVITQVLVPFLEQGEVFRSYRAALRPINSHAITNAAFVVKVEAEVVVKARLVFGAFGSRGTNTGPFRASQTEKALVGQKVTNDLGVEVMVALGSEPWWPQDDYERHLARGFLVKVLHTVSQTPGEFSPAGGVSLSSERVACSGERKLDWAELEHAPIGKGMPKTASKLQTAGEQRYCNDVPEPQHCLYAAYVCIPTAKTVFVSADLSAAESSVGYFDVVSAADIRGMNMWEPSGSAKLLVPQGGASQYAHQPCLIVLADSTRHAEAAARRVSLTLTSPTEAPLLSLEACKKRQELLSSSGEAGGPVSPAATISRGDAETALGLAPRRVKGVVRGDGQKAFYMEPSAALAIPGEDNTLNIWGTAQVPGGTHSCIAATTGLAKHKIVFNSTSLGGGFGGKLTKSVHVICAAAVGAQKSKRPVRFHLNRNVDTVLSAGRLPFETEYEAGFDEAGKLQVVRAVTHGDAGVGDVCARFTLMVMARNMEQIYGIPTLQLDVKSCKTDKAGNTAVRGPGEPEASLIMETILEHVAADLGKDTQEVREANIFTSVSDQEKVVADPLSPDVDRYSALLAIGGEDCANRKLGSSFPALGMWESLKTKVGYAEKLQAVKAFNAENRWRKRGVAMTPVKYPVSNRGQQCLVCLYTDGTCLVTMDGTEIGQGINTKVMQYAAYCLSQIVPGSEVSVDAVRVGSNGTDKVAEGSVTGGSTTSEGVCDAVKEAILKLKERLMPLHQKLVSGGGEVSFKSLCAAAGDVELQASGRSTQEHLQYPIYGVAFSEVEIDVITGESNILSSSLLYDCGKSLNPVIDCGQAEGGFVMGLGYFLRERLLVDEETGKIETDGTWEYKVPCFQDVPLRFDVEFFPRANEGGISSSKASGEPPLVLATSAFCALRSAVASAREQFGKGKEFFRMDAPFTPRDIALSIGAVSEKTLLKGSADVIDPRVCGA